jgi:hypothetical protein
MESPVQLGSVLPLIIAEQPAASPLSDAIKPLHWVEMTELVGGAEET